MSEEEKNLKIVIVGSHAIGKTSALMSITSNGAATETMEYIPTVFDNYSSNIYIGGKLYQIGLWDTAGSEEYDRIRPLSYPNTDIYLFAYSIIDQMSVDEIKGKFLKEVTDVYINEYPEAKPNSPNSKPFIFLISTKEDLREDTENTSMIDKILPIKIEDVAKSIGAQGHLVTSARTGLNMTDILIKAVEAYNKSPQAALKNNLMAKTVDVGCCTIL